MAHTDQRPQPADMGPVQNRLPVVTARLPLQADTDQHPQQAGMGPVQNRLLAVMALRQLPRRAAMALPLQAVTNSALISKKKEDFAAQNRLQAGADFGEVQAIGDTEKP